MSNAMNYQGRNKREAARVARLRAEAGWDDQLAAVIREAEAASGKTARDRAARKAKAEAIRAAEVAR